MILIGMWLCSSVLVNWHDISNALLIWEKTCREGSSEEQSLGFIETANTHWFRTRFWILSGIGILTLLICVACWLIIIIHGIWVLLVWCSCFDDHVFLSGYMHLWFKWMSDGGVHFWDELQECLELGQQAMVDRALRSMLHLWCSWAGGLPSLQCWNSQTDNSSKPRSNQRREWGIGTSSWEGGHVGWVCMLKVTTPWPGVPMHVCIGQIHHLYHHSLAQIHMICQRWISNLFSQFCHLLLHLLLLKTVLTLFYSVLVLFYIGR